MLGEYVKLVTDLKFTIDDFIKFAKSDIVIIESRLHGENIKEISNELLEQLIADKFLDGINKKELK